MPTIKRRVKRERREYGGGHLLQLEVGYDYLDAGWGERFFEWDADTISEVCECWELHRKQILADRAGLGTTFGEFVAEHGLSPVEAIEAMATEHANQFSRRLSASIARALECQASDDE